MSLHSDISYARQVASRLERYKEKRINPYQAEFRCPLCGDSAKKSNKVRGTFFVSPPSPGKEVCLLMGCFNCGASLPFSAFLKDFDHTLYSQYTMEKYRDLRPTIKPVTKEDTALKAIKTFQKTPPETHKYIPSITDGLKSVDDLAENHPVRKYIVDRRLPELCWLHLFYAPKFFKWASGNTDRFKPCKEDHPRLIIPWYSEDGALFAYSARAFGDEQPKYYKIILDETYPPFFGLDKLDKTKPVVVLEGQVDALFLNAVAVGTSTLQRYDNKEAIYLPDPDIRNKEIMKNTKTLIQLGYKVCLASDEFVALGKDVNDWIKSGKTLSEIERMIYKNTFQGLEANLKFLQWSKV